MIINSKSHRHASHIILSVQVRSAHSVDISCRRANALQHAPVKRAALLAAISALAIFSVPYRVGLSLTKTVPGLVILSRSSLSFGNQPVGTSSAAQTVTLRMIGKRVLSVSSLAITGTNASDFAQANNCGSSVAAEANCTISVTFTPTASGTRSASVTITDNATVSPQNVALSGTGTTATATAIPTFSIPGGTYTSAQTVSVSDSTSGAAIYYTTNGTTPTTASTQYTTAIIVGSTETLEAIATASGYSTSPVATATYTITPPAATPSFSVAPGTYASAQTVTISDATAGATIYYTTNGTTPTTSSSQYSGAITVSSTETLEAIATQRLFRQLCGRRDLHDIHAFSQPFAHQLYLSYPGHRHDQRSSDIHLEQRRECALEHHPACNHGHQWRGL